MFNIRIHVCGESLYCWHRYIVPKKTTVYKFFIHILVYYLFYWHIFCECFIKYYIIILWYCWHQYIVRKKTTMHKIFIHILVPVFYLFKSHILFEWFIKYLLYYFKYVCVWSFLILQSHLFINRKIKRDLHFLCFVSSSEDEANMRVSDKDISVFPEWCLSTQCLHSCEHEVKKQAKVGIRWCDFVKSNKFFNFLIMDKAFKG